MQSYLIKFFFKFFVGNRGGFNKRGPQQGQGQQQPPQQQQQQQRNHGGNMNNFNRGGRQHMNNDYQRGNDRYNNDGYNQRDGRDYGRDGRGNGSRPAGNNYHGTHSMHPIVVQIAKHFIDLKTEILFCILCSSFLFDFQILNR